MLTVKSILDQVRLLSEEDQDRLAREFACKRLADVMGKIAARPQSPLPLSDEEINDLVHEGRAEVLRARGL